VEHEVPEDGTDVISAESRPARSIQPSLNLRSVGAIPELAGANCQNATTARWDTTANRSAITGRATSRGRHRPVNRASPTGPTTWTRPPPAPP